MWIACHVLHENHVRISWKMMSALWNPKSPAIDTAGLCCCLGETHFDSWRGGSRKRKPVVILKVVTMTSRFSSSWIFLAMQLSKMWNVNHEFINNPPIIHPNSYKKSGIKDKRLHQLWSVHVSQTVSVSSSGCRVKGGRKRHCLGLRHAESNKMQFEIQLSMLLLYICSFLTPKFHLCFSFCNEFIQAGWAGFIVCLGVFLAKATPHSVRCLWQLQNYCNVHQWPIPGCKMMVSLQDTSDFLISSTKLKRIEEKSGSKQAIGNFLSASEKNWNHPCPPRREYWFHCPTRRHVEGILNEVVQLFHLHPHLQAYSVW